MRVLRSWQTDIRSEIDGVKQKLSITEGVVSPEQQKKTIEVFGEPLAPVEVVKRIIRDVRERGDAAIIEYSEKLDGLSLSAEEFRVSEKDLDDAHSAAAKEFIEALKVAAQNIARFQKHIRITAPSRLDVDGAVTGVQYKPIENVGIYVPGGLASYPSTVLMSVVPAQVAGVQRIALVAPLNRPDTLAAARELGVEEVYRISGVQAIAALAFGAESIKKVDKIVGPGNQFVMLAKREVFGYVGIDMFAGPSEILIIADSTARADFAAADMLSQAEHPGSAILLTSSEKLAERVVEQLEILLPKLSRSELTRNMMEEYCLIVITRSVEESIELANEIAPEHLEIMTENADDLTPKIQNAGAIFVGQYSPEPVGDYIAGPSHILPTAGTARFFSSLSVNDFLKRSSVISYSREALEAVCDHVTAIAMTEGLDAHAQSAAIRFAEDR